MARFSALIFDFDGTVAYTAPDVWEAVEAGTMTFGKKVPPEYRADPRNLSLPVRRIFEDCAGRPLSDTELRTAAAALSRLYGRDTTYSSTVLYPGMDELLDRAKEEHLATGIVTRKSARSLERILRMKGWDHWFDMWYGSESLGGGLTKAELIYGLIRDMPGCENPVYIGDSAGDIEAAREAGVPSIAVTYGDGDTEKLLSAGAGKVCYSVPDVYMWLYNC
ncbi:MAG: HAD family hydrolase [Oscillospiraceae bacterium]|jgi:phosphoglycolate phosphatase